jgi:hypothetical protein
VEPLYLQREGPRSTFEEWHGTGVPFAKSFAAFNFTNEQFWGRAARAPRSRKRFEALVIFGEFFQIFRFRQWLSLQLPK